MTKIFFLGTAGDVHVMSKCIRSSGGIVLQHGDMQLHIDPGPNTLMSAKQSEVNVRATTAIICTAPKTIHSNDVNALISGMTYDGSDIKGVLIGTKSLIEGSEKDSSIIHQSYKQCVERLIVAEPEKKIGIENIDITFCHANDYCDTVGMVIFMPDIVIGYPSDTSYSDKIAKQYLNSDILILNIQLPFGGKEDNKMSSDDAVKFINKIKPKLTIITGFGKEMIERDPMQEARKLNAETGCQVIAAQDGQSLTPTSYSAKASQKQLKQFQ